MQKETKIQGILMCLFYLGHLCLDLVYIASYGTAYTRAYIASYGTAYARAYNASYGTVQEKPAITDAGLWADIHQLRPILYHFLLPRSPSVVELLSVVTRPAVD